MFVSVLFKHKYRDSNESLVYQRRPAFSAFIQTASQKGKSKKLRINSTRNKLRKINCNFESL
jgi:hypothetical protein